MTNQDIDPKKMAPLDESVIYQTQESQLAPRLLISFGIYKWQRIVKSMTVLFFAAFFILEFCHAYCISDQLLNPQFKVSPEAASLLKIYLVGYFASMVGLVTGIVTLIGIWPVKKQEE
jgi:hypothetical protein